MTRFQDALTAIKHWNNVEPKERDTRAKSQPTNRIRALTQQLDNIKNYFDIVQLELTHSYILQKNKKIKILQHTTPAEQIPLPCTRKQKREPQLSKKTQNIRQCREPQQPQREGGPFRQSLQRAWFAPQREISTCWLENIHTKSCRKK